MQQLEEQKELYEHAKKVAAYVESCLIKRERFLLKINLWSLGYDNFLEFMIESSSEIKDKGLIVYTDNIINSKTCNRIKRLNEWHPLEFFLFKRNFKYSAFNFSYPIWGKINILMNNYNLKINKLSPKNYLQNLLDQRQMLNNAESRFGKDYEENKQENYLEFLDKQIEITRNRILVNNEPKEIDLSNQITCFINDRALSSFCLDLEQSGFVVSALDLKEIFSPNQMISKQISSIKKVKWLNSSASLRLFFEWMMIEGIIPLGLKQNINIRISTLFVDKNGNEFDNKKIGSAFSKKFGKINIEEINKARYLGNKEASLLKLIKKYNPNIQSK